MPQNPPKSAATSPRPAHQPRWRPEDLGRPIPDDPHAISVCLPTWKDVIDYEEGEPRVRQALQTGYPRFVLPPQILALHDVPEARQGGGVLAFATPGAARRAMEFVRAQGGEATVKERLGMGWLAPADETSRAHAWKAWRYGGEGASARAAEAAMQGRFAISAAGDVARREIALRLAGLHGVEPEAVFLFTSGMAAVSTVHRFLCREKPGAGTVQIDFPYVDVARVQKCLGSGGQTDMSGEEAVSGGLEQAFAAGYVAGVFTEVPANPMLECADVPAVSAICRAAGVPLVADDTIASVYNVALLRHADFVTSSLSKWFNGQCNLLAGAVIANPASPLAQKFRRWLAGEEPARLADADARALAANSREFSTRMAKVNASAAVLAAFLRDHPAVGRVWYPSLESGHPYAKVAQPGGGTGGLISFRLRDGEAAAERFYDALELDKGPSLGADFSLLCPYTLLAHYDELEHAAAWGVPRDLLRLSVGTEPVSRLLEILGRALAAAAN